MKWEFSALIAPTRLRCNRAVMSNHVDSGYPASEPLRLLRAREVADRLAVSEPTVWRLGRAGMLRKVRIGGSTRFHPDDVDDLIAGRDLSSVVHIQDEGPAGRPSLVNRHADAGGGHGTG